jgi:hypothetical protein
LCGLKLSCGEESPASTSPAIRLQHSHHGSRAPEKEEQILNRKSAAKAEVEEGQSTRKSHHRSQLVGPHSPILLPALQILFASAFSEIAPGTKKKPSPKTTAV